MLFFDHGNDSGHDGDSVMGLIGVGYTPIGLRRKRLSPSATGMANQGRLGGDVLAPSPSSPTRDEHGCLPGETFDRIDNFCRPAPRASVATIRTKRAAQALRTSAPSPISPSVVAPSPVSPSTLPSPGFLVAPGSQAAAPSVFVLEPSAQEESFLDKEIVGKVKVKHALLGGGAVLLLLGGAMFARSRRD